MVEEEADVGDDADGLAGAAVRDFGDDGGVDVDADDFDPGGEHVAGGDGVEHGGEAEDEAGVVEMSGVGVLGFVHVGDGVGEGAVVTEGAGQDVGDFGFDEFIHDAGGKAAGFDCAGDAAGLVDGVDGAHVVAVAVFFEAAVGDADAEGGAEQGRFDVMNGEGVAGEHGVDPAVADEFGQGLDASGVNDDGACDEDDLLAFLADGLHEGGGLADGLIDLAFRADFVAHEGEAEAVAFLGFGDDADAAHAVDDFVTLFEIAEAAAEGFAILDDHHGVHALVAYVDPFAIEADLGAVVGGGVEVFGGAEILLDGARGGVAIVGGSAAEAEELGEEGVHQLACGGFEFEAELGGVGVGAADLKFFDFKFSLELNDGVEDPFHDVGVD